MKYTWLKLYFEILDDPKMGRLPDHTWRRAIEIFLLAGEHEKDGLLPSLDDMAWRLHTSVDELVDILTMLSQVGVVHETAEGWVVTNFKKRQYSESYERVKRYRNAKSNAGRNADEADLYLSSSSSESLDSSSDSEGEGVGEGVPIPETPAQAMKHPAIQLFQQVCGRIPGERDYAGVIETIQFLHKEHGDGLLDYLKPFWLKWSTSKTREQKPYNPASLVWLYEWAMNGQVPRLNGHEPQLRASNQDIIRKVAQHAKR